MHIINAHGKEQRAIIIYTDIHQICEKSVAMIPVKDITKVTGYVRGGCSPVGMKKAYVTRIDASAQAFDAIFVSAGRLGQQLRVRIQAAEQRATKLDLRLA